MIVLSHLESVPVVLFKNKNNQTWCNCAHKFAINVNCYITL